MYAPYHLAREMRYSISAFGSRGVEYCPDWYIVDAMASPRVWCVEAVSRNLKKHSKQASITRVGTAKVSRHAWWSLYSVRTTKMEDIIIVPNAAWGII